MIVEKMKVINNVFQGSKRVRFYVLTGFDSKGRYDQSFWRQDLLQTFERIRILMGMRAYPYIMRYEKYRESPYREMYVNLSRWCNQPHMFKRMKLCGIFAFWLKMEVPVETICKNLKETFQRAGVTLDMKFID